jgi:hypothetical protein
LADRAKISTKHREIIDPLAKDQSILLVSGSAGSGRYDRKALE